MSGPQPGRAPVGSYPYPYPSAPYAGAAPPQPPRLPPTPAQRVAPRALVRVSVLVLSLLAVAGTAAALYLGYLAPTLAPREPAPTAAGLTRVFAGALDGSVAGQWDQSGGCTFTAGGLHALAWGSGALCAYLPSQGADLVSQGFQLSATVGPANDLAGLQQPCIALQSAASIYSLAISQAGQYDLAADPASTCELGAGLGESDAWHADGYTPNRVTLRYAAGTLTLYLNGQQVSKHPASLDGAYTISLGASPGDEAVFSAFALYSASAGAP